MEREHQNPGVIFLVAGSTRITLDGSIRDLFHFQPDTSELTGSATDGSANDAIYGIWCNRCNGYVYAGQSVSVQRRACGHHTTMKYKSDSLLGKHAREHSTSDYDRIFSLDVVWRVDLGHSTYRKLQANSPEAKKLRSWEIFFQWFFKVHVDEGGCSKKWIIQLKISPWNWLFSPEPFLENWLEFPWTIFSGDWELGVVALVHL